MAPFVFIKISAVLLSWCTCSSPFYFHIPSDCTVVHTCIAAKPYPCWSQFRTAKQMTSASRLSAQTALNLFELEKRISENILRSNLRRVRYLTDISGCTVRMGTRNANMWAQIFNFTTIQICFTAKLTPAGTSCMLENIWQEKLISFQHMIFPGLQFTAPCKTQGILITSSKCVRTRVAIAPCYKMYAVNGSNLYIRTP